MSVPVSITHFHCYITRISQSHATSRNPEKLFSLIAAAYLFLGDGLNVFI